MDKDIAKAIVEEVLRQEASINKLFEMSKEIADPKLKEKLV